MSGRNARLKYLIVMLFVLVIGVSGVDAMDDSAKHFWISSVCGAGSETYLHYRSEIGPVGRILIAGAIGSVPGLIKEIKDSTEEGNEFGMGDMAADVLGSFAGAIAGSLINDVIEVRVLARHKGAEVAVVWKF